MIRPVQTRDCDAIFALVKEFATSFVADETSFNSSFAALVGDSRSYLAVAELDGEIVGYVLAFSHLTFYANGPVAWVEEITVETPYRQRGIGRALMESAEDWAAQRGCRLIALATRRAAPFYEAIGYEASATYYRMWFKIDEL